MQAWVGATKVNILDPKNSLGINIKALLLNHPLSPEDAKIVAPSALTPSPAKAGSSAAVTLPVGPAILSLLFSQAYQATMMQPELKDHEPDTESEVAVSVETTGNVLIITIKCPSTKTLDGFTKISLPITSPFTWASPDSQQCAPTPRRWVSDPMSSPGINQECGVVPGILLPSFSGPSLVTYPSELNKSSSFTTPHWTAIDLKNLVRGSSSEVYLVVKDSRSSILEMYNIRTRSTVIIHEYDGTPFSGYILLASNLEGWILLSRNTHAYFLNLVSRDHSDLPMLNRNIGPSAQGAFRGSPNRESMLTVVLELEFHQALIVAHRPATGWLYFNVPTEVQMLRIESFKVTVNRIFWVASGLLFCCSHEQFLWRIPIAMGGNDKSVLDYRGDVYLLVVNQELTEGQIFYVNADNGDLIAKEDFTGLIFTTREAGGVVSPSGSFHVLGAGGCGP